MPVLADFTKKEKVLFGLLLLFIITLFFSKLSGPNAIATGFVVLYSFYLSSFKEKLIMLKERKFIAGILLFFLLLLASTLISDDMATGFHHLKIRLPLLLFPASLGLLLLRKEFKEKVLLAFAVITTAVAILCLVTAIQASNFFQKPEFLYNDALTAVTRKQSIYMALAVNIAIFIYAKAILFQRSRYKIAMLFAVLFLYLFSYLLASRIMFAWLFAATVVFSGYYILNRKKYLEGATLVLGLVMGIFIIHKMMPSTFNRYKELLYTDYKFDSKGPESHYNMEITADQWNGANFRLAAWTCGWEVFQASPLKGVDLGDKDAALNEKYREKNFIMAIETEKNVHSNYLDVLFSTGVIGLIVFLFAWLILPLRSALKTKDPLAFIVILMFATAWIFEVYFGRNFGAMLVGFFFSLLLVNRGSPAPEPIEKD